MMSSSQRMKTLVQCDFDGTVTEEDISFLLLDKFARGDWRQFLEDYKEHKILVGYFNRKAFALIRSGRQALLDTLRDIAKVRPGFSELVAHCRRRNFRLVIVSNGLDFYIEKILKDIGVEDVEIHAAEARFRPAGIEVRYVGPDGTELEDNFKGAYTKLFLSQGYRIIYAGNGDSDIPAARLAHHVFARGDLLAYYQKNNLKCEPLEDFNDMVRGLEHL